MGGAISSAEAHRAVVEAKPIVAIRQAMGFARAQPILRATASLSESFISLSQNNLLLYLAAAMSN
jgi:hypothetical protein